MTVSWMESAYEDFEEREASRVAMNGTAFERTALGLRALTALMRDPNDTKQVFYLGVVMNRGTYPRFLARFTNDDEGARLLRERCAIDSAHVDYTWLRTLPEHTLGGAYVHFLDANGLNPDLFQAPLGLPEVPAYIGQRMRQVHDLWHVLTGYSTDVGSELALQAFTWAQTGVTSSAMVAIVGALRFSLRNPRILPHAVDGYRRGKKAKFLAPVRWEIRFERPLDEVRAEFGLDP
jgi:ubiquinone biosynthesis protein COQ4